MSIFQNLRDNLEIEGYCVGNLSEILSQEQIESLKRYRDETKVVVENEKSRYFVCRYNYQPPNNEPQTYPDKIPLSAVEERDNYIRENNLFVWQKWFESSNPPNSKDLLEVPFSIFLDTVKSIYPEYEYDKYHIARGDLSLFEDGHFICKHHDGKNEGRICVILVYLTDQEEYNDGGGELILESVSGKRIEVSPHFGTFCLLDFTKNNIEHSVKEVRNGFKRLTYINFITLRDLKNPVI